MKVLYFQSGMHVKNHHALVNYKNISLHVIDTLDLDRIDLSQYDVVYSPCQPIEVRKYPNTKFIFGPHFSVFPEEHQMNMISGKNSIYIQPSEWVAKVWQDNPICNNINVLPLPFGVDTERFKDIKPITERDKVFIYFKQRNHQELYTLCKFLENKKIEYVIFSYKKRYSESDYINYLQNSKFCLWLDAHESQGFALEEALSCNVPLLVWNVSSMNQEYASTYSNIPATTIPYWDDRCGEYFYHEHELEEIFNRFLSKIETYRPREYILENLSMELCEKKFIDIMFNIFDTES
jgi:hypothetical protein